MRQLLSHIRRLALPRKRAPLNLLYERDSDFARLYQEGLVRTQTPDVVVDGYPKRFVRFYNTAQYFVASQRVEGKVLECGCWRGLSMYVFASLARLAVPTFDGSGFTVVDSFEGLDAPGQHDPGSVPPGTFACDRETVRANLGDFPQIELVKGWIPDVLTSLPESQYRFVHIDVDHYAPIRGALEYFVPRLAAGGVLVVDDYGSLQFPGARRAVEEHSSLHRVAFVGLSSGQAVLWR